jgi:hypothetical protein
MTEKLLEVPETHATEVEVDPVARLQLHAAICSYLEGCVTSDEFEELVPRSGDPAIKGIYEIACAPIMGTALRVYDVKTRPLSEEDRARLKRVLAFLESNQPYLHHTAESNGPSSRTQTSVIMLIIIAIVAVLYVLGLGMFGKAIAMLVLRGGMVMIVAFAIAMLFGRRARRVLEDELSDWPFANGTVE